ncbi:hypothetical protein HPP92_003223 [Vanilla planifolia]|uniref:Uncharacterized protein n=1 Tax=Vanilla planifolia TaxID=51239 RepID=A0A835S376_VANPL|nr:hypothetical protein HPP92_003223 [Vanilla planifolia]
MADVVMALRHLQDLPFGVVIEDSRHLRSRLPPPGEKDELNDHGMLDEETAADRDRVVAEAIEWVSNNSRNGQRSRHGTEHGN